MVNQELLLQIIGEWLHDTTPPHLCLGRAQSFR